MGVPRFGPRFSKRAVRGEKVKNKSIPKELPDREVRKFKKLPAPTEVAG